MLDSPPDAPTPDLVLGPTSVDASIQGCLAKSLSACNKVGEQCRQSMSFSVLLNLLRALRCPFAKFAQP